MVCSIRMACLLELDHLEVFLARAAFGAGPVGRHVLPARAGRYAFLRRAGLLVVDPAADQAHVLFHRAAAGSVLRWNRMRIVAIHLPPPARPARIPCLLPVL